MKTNQDYQMFFQGYLEALTDIDGDQREFGVRVKMFNSSHKEHISDIEKEFGYKEPVVVINSKKFRNFYSVEHILDELIFVKLFNDAKVPKKSLHSFRRYVNFHLTDYIDFAFDDAKYILGSKKKFEMLMTRGENVNRILLVMSAKNKKLIFSFYRNKKYVSDKEFDKWTQKIIQREEKRVIAFVKKWGIREHKISSFLYKDYNKKEILESAYEISICSPIKSKSIEKICAKEKWRLKKLIPLYAKGLNEVYGDELEAVEKIAKWGVIKGVFKVGYKEEYKFKERLQDMIKAVKTYNQKFHTKESLKKFPSNNKYGYAISPDIHQFLRSFEKLIDKQKNDEDIANALKQKYQKESMKEVWKEISFMLREIKINNKEG